MSIKICSTCLIEKSTNEFCKNKRHKDGLNRICKNCKNTYSKQYRENNQNKLNQYNKQYRENNPEYFKEYNKRWKNNNPEYFREWTDNNRELINSRTNQRNKLKRQNNPEYRIQESTRSNIYRIVKNKTERTNKYLGCNFREYKIYLEKQFDENMNWENYGTYWEIDHIQPLSKGGSFHYPNTRPLNITENRKKYNKL
jgi:hypothetical protein